MIKRWHIQKKGVRVWLDRNVSVYVDNKYLKGKKIYMLTYVYDTAIDREVCSYVWMNICFIVKNWQQAGCYESNIGWSC